VHGIAVANKKRKMPRTNFVRSAGGTLLICQQASINLTLYLQAVPSHSFLPRLKPWMFPAVPVVRLITDNTEYTEKTKDAK
jgi:hypothetical protein